MHDDEARLRRERDDPSGQREYRESRRTAGGADESPEGGRAHFSEGRGVAAGERQLCRPGPAFTIALMGGSPGGPTANFTHHFLIAMPTMADPRFSQTLTYVCEHNADGALGIVVNKPTEMTLSSLFEQIDVPLADEELRRTPVHFGGPVQVDRGFVLHRPLGNWQSTLAVDDDVGLTTSKDVLEAVARGEGPKDVIISLGYAGWSAGQLEEEIAQNAWLTVAADPRRPVRHAGRRTPARGDAAPRHRLLAVVRRCRARMTRGVDGTRQARRRSLRSISERGGSASRWATR